MPYDTRDADGYLLSDDPARFDVALAHQWIAGQSYWAAGIPMETFARACATA